MDLLRSVPVRVFVVFATILWAWASTSAAIHPFVVQHATCEHGDVVEVHAAGGAQVGPAGDDATDRIGAADVDEDHEHGCGVPPSVLALRSPHLRVPSPWALALPHPAPWWAGAAARGPPLAYAPKTSPPALA